MARADRIVFFARDPGAANLLKDLFAEARDYAPEFFAKDFARDVLARAGVPHRDFNAETSLGPSARANDREAIRGWLRSLHGVPLVITGTTHYDDMTDRLIWEECHELGIATAAVLDQWIRIQERFVLPDGSTWRPDYVLGPDRSVVATLEELEIPRRRADVLPLPHLSELFRARPQRRAAGVACRASLEERFGRKIGFLAVYVSEPQSQLSAKGTQFTDVRFDEFELYDDVARAFAKQDLADGLLLVKQHPKEAAGTYASRTPFAVQSEVDNLALAAAADLLIGTKSMLLIQGAVLGKSVLSLDYACADGERLVTNGLGLSRAARTRADLDAQMAEAVKKGAGPTGEALAQGLALGVDWRMAWRSILSRLWDEAGY